MSEVCTLVFCVIYLSFITNCVSMDYDKQTTHVHMRILLMNLNFSSPDCHEFAAVRLRCPQMIHARHHLASYTMHMML